MVTVKDVAERAGVSVATASAVINRSSKVRVSEKLTKRVEKAVIELNYRPNRIARALRKQETNTIGYIVPSVSNQVFAQLTRVVEDLAFARDYVVYICNTYGSVERVKNYIETLTESRVMGVVATLTWDVAEAGLVDAMLEKDIAVVGLGGARIIQGIDIVGIDDFAGGKTGTRYLIENGHSRIGFIGISDSETTEQRHLGYVKALQEADLRVNENWTQLGTGFSSEEGCALAKRLITANPEVSAIFVFNDVLASGVIEGARELGKRVPEDISIIGFDDSIAKYTTPKLTTMALPKEEMAEKAMELLFTRIEDASGSRKHIRVSPILVARESTAAL